MSDDWFVFVEGKEYGPLSAATLQQYALENRIAPDTLVRQGPGEWGPAQAVQGLQFAAPQLVYAEPPKAPHAPVDLSADLNPLSILAAMAGMSGLFFVACCGFFALPLSLTAITLGTIALRQSGGGWSFGKRLAFTGIILGVLGVFLSGGLFLLLAASSFSQR